LVPLACTAGGSREGKIVVVQNHDVADPGSGGSCTTKRSRSLKAADGDSERYVEIRIELENPKFPPIVLHEGDEGNLQVAAELVEALRP
jgi:hypothetical protein